MVFPESKPSEWKVSTTDAPATASYCHIDLCHNSTALEFDVVPAEQRPEVFGPFIRVTNSYHGLRALAFNVGFYRKVCKNGLIVADSIIRFSFTHLRRDIGEAIQFQASRTRLAQLKSSFTTFVAALHKCAVGRAEFEPFICGALSLRKPGLLKPDDREAQDWQTLTAHLGQLSDRYAGELGENAYAVFNAVTDFASHPPTSRCVRRDRHSLQRLAGSWLNAFTHECRKPDFSVAKYLAELARAETESDTQDAAKREAA